MNLLQKNGNFALQDRIKAFLGFRKKRLKPAWVYISGGIIWRLLFSESGALVGESRDDKRKRAEFFCLDSQNGLVRWSHLSLDESWWIGIEALHGEVLLLHGFLKPDMPEHRKIVAVDLASGQVLWKNDDVTFWFAHGGKAYSYKTLFERRVGYAFDVKSGELVEEFPDGLDKLDALREVLFGKGEEANMFFPNIHDPQNPDAVISNILQEQLKSHRIAGSVEYISLRGKLLFNFYEDQKKTVSDPVTLTNTFCIIDVSSGKTVFTEVLNHDVKAPVPDSFFVREDSVYFVKDHNTLTALQPWKS
ncbi:MAG: DUF4905 domain-containing protein [Bacteroidota bacterium]